MSRPSSAYGNRYRWASHLPLVLALGLMAGCATIHTLPDERVGLGHLHPRVYSGAAYDYGVMMGEYPPGDLGSGFASVIALIDLPFSIVVDTIVLPYTLYTQIALGSGSAHRKDPKGHSGEPSTAK